jgi:Glycosyltransferase
MKLPKVLIIGQPFNSDTGGGITLTNLFAGWERDKIAVICSGYLLENNIDTHVCNTYYQLGHDELKWIFPFNLVNRKYASGIMKFDEKRIQNLSIKKSKVRLKLILNYFLPTMDYTGLIHMVKRLKLSNQLCNFLDEFKPDLIYVQATDRDKISFCLELHSYLKKPMVFHMMDDWPSVITNKGLFKNYWKRTIDSELQVLLQHSNKCLSICEEMSIEYKTRYNQEFTPFHNPVDLDVWKPYQRNNYELSNSPTLLYAGRIGLGIDDSLELIAKAIDQVNEDLNVSIRFILQTSFKPQWAKKYKCAHHQAFVSYNELPKVFSAADFLILPYDFSKKSIKFIKYSMPTKASEFMISGTPIIIFAPQETAIVKYAQKYNWAKVITEDNSMKIVDSIKSLIQSKAERQSIAENAIRLAEENHDASKIRRNFKEIICTLAENAEYKSHESQTL